MNAPKAGISQPIIVYQRCRCQCTVLYLGEPIDHLTRLTMSASLFGAEQEDALRTFAALCIALCAPVATIAPANAGEPFYIGMWKFSGAVVAPWADPQRMPDSTEQSRLLGKTIVLKVNGIDGPRPFACTGPKYKVSDFTANLIFQGAFEAMQSNNKSVDPNKIAASLGFSGTSIKTLETGCEIDFHFVDTTTAEIGLNDYIYTLKKL